MSADYFRAYGVGPWLPATDEAIAAVYEHGTNPVDLDELRASITTPPDASAWLDLNTILERLGNDDTRTGEARRHWLNSFAPGQVSRTGHQSP